MWRIIKSRKSWWCSKCFSEHSAGTLYLKVGHMRYCHKHWKELCLSADTMGKTGVIWEHISDAIQKFCKEVITDELMKKAESLEMLSEIKKMKA